MEIEKSEKKFENGGARIGAGRPKGGYNKETLEKKKVEKAMEKKIMRQVDVLLASQFNLAKGCAYLYKIIKETDSKGVKHKSKPILVTNKKEIEDYLAGEFENGDDGEEGYYFITTDKPDNLAINSLIDRVYGKPKQKIVGGDVDDDPINVSVVYLPTPNPSDE